MTTKGKTSVNVIFRFTYTITFSLDQSDHIKLYINYQESTEFWVDLQ